MAEMGAVGKAGAIAEESILGVRTVQSLNGQREMVERCVVFHGEEKRVRGGRLQSTKLTTIQRLSFFFY